MNHATTCHKLQGRTVTLLVMAQWSKDKKWAYVVISRVRALGGVFLTSPIPEEIHFSPASEYFDMMANLRQTILTTPEQVAELKATLN